MSQITTAVRGAMGKLSNFLGRGNQILNTNADSAGGVTFAIKTDIVEVGEKLRLRMLVYFDDKVANSILSEVRKAALRNVADVLQPITRTGTLRDSFEAKVIAPNRQVLIYSDLPAATAIQQGFYTGGPIENLMSWMENKAEFSSYDDKKKRSVAFAIKYNIENGRRPGPNSTLSSLHPYGKRQFDYMSDVTALLSNDIAGLLEEFAIEASK